MSESGYIGAKGPMVRTSLECIQWMRKHPPAWVCETYLDMDREKNEEIDRMARELILLKKYMDDVDEENMRLRLSGLGPKEHKEEVEKLRREVETFQQKAQLLAQENADMRDSVHHLAQMVIAGSPTTVGVDKAIQAEPAVADKEVQSVSRTYADVLSQSEREEEKVEVKRGTGTTDDEEIIDAPVPKPTNLRLAASPSAKHPTNNTATGRTARAFVVHGVACLGPMAAKIREVERAFGTQRGGVIGVRWLLKGSRRWG